MDYRRKVTEIDTLVEKHKSFRESCLNLIASETRPSPLVERLIVNDLDHRYGSYTGIDPRNRGYPGNAFLTQMEEVAQDLAKQLFGAAYVDLRPLSGNIAGLIAMFALGRPGDTVLEVHNGHMYAAKLANSGLNVELKSIRVPWDAMNANIDLDRTVSLIREHRPGLVSIGSAHFVFPQPVRELRAAMDRYSPGSILVYDAAHVMGLIAGGRFQSPLTEGADVIITSTHKTLAGPQGGYDPDQRQGRRGTDREGDIAADDCQPPPQAVCRRSRVRSWSGWRADGRTPMRSSATPKRWAGRCTNRARRWWAPDRGFTESHTVLPVVDAFGERRRAGQRVGGLPYSGQRRRRAERDGETRPPHRRAGSDPIRHDGGGCPRYCRLHPGRGEQTGPGRGKGTRGRDGPAVRYGAIYPGGIRSGEACPLTALHEGRMKN